MKAPEHPDALRARGELADAALGYARKAVTAPPAEAAGLRLLQAECWAELGEPLRARRAVEKALALQPASAVLERIRQHPELRKLLPP